MLRGSRARRKIIDPTPAIIALYDTWFSPSQHKISFTFLGSSPLPVPRLDGPIPRQRVTQFAGSHDDCGDILTSCV